jgi:hypothetical protein
VRKRANPGCHRPEARCRAVFRGSIHGVTSSRSSFGDRQIGIDVEGADMSGHDIGEVPVFAVFCKVIQFGLDAAT